MSRTSVVTTVPQVSERPGGGRRHRGCRDEAGGGDGGDGDAVRDAAGGALTIRVHAGIVGEAALTTLPPTLTTL